MLILYIILLIIEIIFLVEASYEIFNGKNLFDNIFIILFATATIMMLFYPIINILKCK